MHEDQPKLPTIESLDNIEEHYYQIDQDVDAVFSDYSDVDDCFEPQVEVTESMDEDKIKEVADMSLNGEESNVSETSVTCGNDNSNDHDSSMDRVGDSLENIMDITREVKVEDNLEMEDNILEDEDNIADIEHDGKFKIFVNSWYFLTCGMWIF